MTVESTGSRMRSSVTLPEMPAMQQGSLNTAQFTLTTFPCIAFFAETPS